MSDDTTFKPVPDRPVLRIEPPVIDKEWMLGWLGYQMKRLGERIVVRGETSLTAEYEKLCHAYESLESGKATFTVTRHEP